MAGITQASPSSGGRAYVAVQRCKVHAGQDAASAVVRAIEFDELLVSTEEVSHEVTSVIWIRIPDGPS